MPPPSGRMTKNRVKDFRYRPGKAEAEDDEDDDYDSDEEEEEEQEAAPAPKPSSFPSKKKTLAIDLSRADQQRPTEAPVPDKPDDDLEGFVTASESEAEDDNKKDSGNSDEDEDSEHSSSDDDDSSSDDEPKKPMLAPKFLSKAQRAKQTSAQQPTKSASELAAQEEARRVEKADEALRAQIALDAAARAAGKKAWDDDDNIADEVDDTDDLDPEAERAAWKLRELKRVRRDRLAIEEKEAEREEIERRRNLTAEEREAEDAEFIKAQQEDREGKGKMAFMQKYHHKGAFFQGDEEQDEEVKAALNRDLAGARFEDETASKDVLPEYMKIRDMSLLGRKGRTKYKDLKSEDTGRWGVGQGRKRDYDGLDDRFRPDDGRDGGRERTGANDIAVGERKPRRDEGGREEKRSRYE